MKTLFWLSLAGVLYTYAGYPLLLALLARCFSRRWQTAAITPSVSVVLAVHNGARLLDAKIDHLLALDYPNLAEIIVVSDGSTDETAELLSAHSDPRLQAVILTEQGGKAAAVNAGVQRATSEILLFVDIRPEIAPGAIQELVSNFADASVGCVTGELVLRRKGHDAASAAVSGLYWRYEKWMRSKESSFASPVGVYGGFYAIRRSLAVDLPAGTILDDMYQPLAIIHQGYRSVIDPAAIVYDTWPDKIEHEFQRKVRTLAGNFQLFQLAPWALAPANPVFFQLFSHKVMRLVVPYLVLSLLASSLALGAHSAVFAAFAALQIFGWALSLVALRYRIPLLHRIAAPASAILVLQAAAVVGLYKFLFTRGPLWKIWVPTATPAKLAAQ